VGSQVRAFCDRDSAALLAAMLLGVKRQHNLAGGVIFPPGKISCDSTHIIEPFSRSTGNKNNTESFVLQAIWEDNKSALYFENGGKIR